MAAGIPLLLGLTAVVATFGLIALPSQLLPVAEEAYAMVLLVGLAVGVDYSMFYLKRNARNGPPAAACVKRSRSQPRPPAVRCSSRASR